MDNLEKIARFEEAINKAADDEIGALLADTKRNAREAVKCADEAYLEECYHTVSSETKNIKRKFAHEISQRKFEAAKEVFAHRSMRVEEFFDRLEEEISDFSKTPEYEKRLIALTEETEKESAFNQNTVIYVKPEDEEKLKKHFPNVKICADKKIKLGGVLVFFPERSVFADKTFDSAFAEQKAEFVNNKIMQL
ncbi:MAG TPA: hypothetical protein DDX91_00665 [Ruminococcaceae bacterium]|nr:hypothetical protein [Oscillospiraceae bacterium]